MLLVSGIEIIKKAKQPVLAIEKISHVENLSIIIDECYKEIQNYLNKVEEYPGDIPL